MSVTADHFCYKQQLATLSTALRRAVGTEVHWADSITGVSTGVTGVTRLSQRAFIGAVSGVCPDVFCYVACLFCCAGAV